MRITVTSVLVDDQAKAYTSTPTSSASSQNTTFRWATIAG